MSAGGPSSGLPPRSPPSYPPEMDRYLKDQQQHHVHQQQQQQQQQQNSSRNFSQDSNHDGSSQDAAGPFHQQQQQGNMNGKPNYDQAARLRQTYNQTRSASPLSRPPLFSPSMLHEAERNSSQQRPPSIPNATSPPPRTNVTSPRYLLESRQTQNWMPRSNGMGPLDFHPSISPVSFNSIDRPHSSMSENTFAASQDSVYRPNMSTTSSGSGSAKDSEFSIFVGDLSPDLREEDLVTQFLQPPAWLPHHPFAAALIHAQQAQGIWQPGSRLGPAPFLSTKSAKIMTDPVTNASKGYGFVRFNLESDCNRALVEMQGVVITPSNGMSPGRPLRVSTATPKNRSLPPVEPGHLQMPRPHNPAQSASAAFLYAHPNGNGNGINLNPNNPPYQQQPQPPQQQHPQYQVQQQQQFRQQQASPSSFTSPISPSYDSPNGPPQQRSLHAMHTGYPSAPDTPLMPPQQRSHSPPMSASQHDSAADPNNTTVFVGGLSSLISEATLRRYFEHFGEITYVKIPSGKGCGFVQFVRKQDAETAIQRMNGFPILNSKIRLSWGRSQGDKAAAAAAQTMAQYAQLGQLAGLAGLSTLSPSQLAQLAGLGSALSAAQANTQGSNEYANDQAAVAALANDPLSTLARQLAAANSGPPFHHQQAPPQMPPFHHGINGHGTGFDMDPRSVAPRSHSQPGNGVRSPDNLQEHALRSRQPFPHGLTSPPPAEADLASAFANMDFAEQRLPPYGQQQQQQRGDNFRSSYNRDPNAFMFSPFSPADSPIVGAKTDLASSQNPRFAPTPESPNH